MRFSSKILFSCDQSGIIYHLSETFINQYELKKLFDFALVVFSVLAFVEKSSAIRAKYKIFMKQLISWPISKISFLQFLNCLCRCCSCVIITKLHFLGCIVFSYAYFTSHIRCTSCTASKSHTDNQRGQLKSLFFFYF